MIQRIIVCAVGSNNNPDTNWGPPSQVFDVDDVKTAFGRDIKASSLKRSTLKPASVSLSSKLRMPAAMDCDQQSVSTLSGSGMDFFRKFVQRKGRSADSFTSKPENVKNVKEWWKTEIQKLGQPIQLTKEFSSNAFWCRSNSLQKHWTLSSKAFSA